ncbi:TsaC protein required for threonylcarbamoyladenosine t(6)A37 modification in tRNA [Geitlerinema sp. FC II]|uniref:L-threonylcarbamoyladenylate synthase n=1 Tax=Baaleninema simplex TaxID=2862350 RepID=UPI000347E174|nr:L-threonylcarbamoyladenylate synthase [Baaleninema simplex]MDC0834936.1 L-threonylcarbamoyladenylate synthase [Geitlerinema sp. CS-897]PPT08076.1 TsaC protein required for threonylcarbamoyladenosine t(6)A37 modification in tRNA [Geitlerinema sp. FC II]
MSARNPKLSVRLIPEILHRLQGGEVVLLPTATTYALVGNASDMGAIARIRQLKQQSSSEPLALFARLDTIDRFARPNADARALIAKFPYPVTLVLPKTDEAPEGVTAGFDSLLVCCPDEFIYQLVGESPFPLACASASISSDLKATNCRAAVQLFGDRVSFIVDGGSSKYGRGGTMVDCTLDRPTILKYGPVSVDDLRPIVPNVELPSHMRK